MRLPVFVSTAAGLLLLAASARAQKPGASFPGVPPPPKPVILTEGAEPPVGQREPIVVVQLNTNVQSGFLVLYEPGAANPTDPATWSDVVVFASPTHGITCAAGDPASNAILVSDAPGETGITDADLSAAGTNIAQILACGAFTVYQQEGTRADGLNVYTPDAATEYDVYSDAEGVPPINPTHYWTYHVLGAPPQPTPISVRDQFHADLMPVTVDSLVYLFNWVHKDGSAVLDTMVHFTGWNIVEKPPLQKTALISNQFGSGRVYLSHMAFLMAPAWKNTDLPGTPSASHYVCYRASGFLPRPVMHSIVDEWRADQQIPDSLVYFCAPCQKLHNTNLFFPTDTVTHLALYRVHPESPLFTPILKDQFVARTFGVQQLGDELLAVPSTKTDVAAVGPETPATGFALGVPQPNPTRTAATVAYTLPRDLDVRLDVLDVGGRRIANLARGTLSAGSHVALWNLRDAGGRRVRAGVYVLRLAAGGREVERLLAVTR